MHSQTAHTEPGKEREASEEALKKLILRVGLEVKNDHLPLQTLRQRRGQSRERERSLRKTLKIKFRGEYCRLKNLSYLCTPFGREGEKTERKSKDISFGQGHKCVTPSSLK